MSVATESIARQTDGQVDGHKNGLPLPDFGLLDKAKEWLERDFCADFFLFDVRISFFEINAASCGSIMVIRCCTSSIITGAGINS